MKPPSDLWLLLGAESAKDARNLFKQMEVGGTQETKSRSSELYGLENKEAFKTTSTMLNLFRRLESNPEGRYSDGEPHDFTVLSSVSGDVFDLEAQTTKRRRTRTRTTTKRTRAATRTTATARRRPTRPSTARASTGARRRRRS